ncbi:DNA mismatch repair endonuclease MutL [Sediminicola luteus]|uniref:DNA mismatch repair protein MutL n=1 Tax=Sediminicola luteus TaxID=319238 RepID=A0A2A4G886_9FLAO|nr:DNA mismatch repair endonuclease MutL [Sediminicola luteus]PCE64837.1 DNA mismatch repair protein MutL [Sediminicola luteus]
MGDVIKLLPDHVANQIAAGEVVQRPASVVKELLENAIDAGAQQIQLIVKEAGKTLIQVVDDGKGMGTTDARMSFERHATSKIEKAEDLFALQTKGFRGEALASIAAIAHVEMNTRPEGEELGTRLVVEGSKVVSQESAVVPKGTSIQVKNLFFNIPARRNFLKSNQVELRHITDEFHRVALVHPNINFRFYHNGSELFHLPVSNIRQRIVNIFGTKTNEKLVPVTEDTHVVNISGFINKPEFARKSRGEQFFFVNDRFIKSSYLNHAVSAAFEGLLKSDTFPGYFLFLEVDPGSVDINIHPTKTEVKFDDEHSIYAIIRAAVKHSLGQFQVAPVLDFEHDENLQTPYGYKDKSAVLPKVTVDAGFNPFAEEPPKMATTKTASASGGGFSTYKPERAPDWQSLYVGLDQATPEVLEGITIESETLTGSIFEEKEEETVKGTTFQLRRKYIVTTIKSGMVIIDQGRAHQRVLYEKFLKNITVQQGVSQQLLFPIELEFTLSEIGILESLRESMEKTGFVFGAFDAGKLELVGLPPLASEQSVPELFEGLLASFREGIPHDGFSQADVFAKQLGKSLAVRTGEVLDEASQMALVHDLFACKEPQLSPFNKTVYITLSEGDIDKKFM